jgi:cell division protein FtsQ
VSKAKVKRGKAPARRPVRTPQRRKSVGPSRLDQMIAALPVGPATLQRMANWTIGSVLVVAAGFAAHFGGVTKWAHDEWADAVGRAGFQVKRVEVVGANRIDYLKVYDIALGQQNRSMAAVDLAAVRQDLLQYGWIKDARVSRRLPETLVIDIVERSPAAIWQHNQKLSLIDANGVVLEPVTPATMPDLPLVIGPKANQRSRELAALLDGSSSIKPLLAGATWVGNRRWDLRFDSGETLSLPEGEAAAKRALAKFTHLEGSNRLLGRGIVRFDMRDPSRFVLRMPPEGQIKAIEQDGDAAASAADATQDPADSEV